MFRTEQEWMQVYEQRGSFWMHDGNRLRPHALLTSGLHSSGFFFSKPVTEDAELRDQAASDLVDRLIDAGVDIEAIDCVVGPATGATTLAESMACDITRRRGRLCRWASPTKHEEGGVKSMVFTTTNILPGDWCLITEDVATTGASAGLAADAVIRAGGEVFAVMCALVNRSDPAKVNPSLIIALITKHLPTWESDSCPLCAAGSEVIKAKVPPENWVRLTQDYPAN